MNDLKRLQRKLIPVNLIVSIIALVAAISILFAPLLSFDLGAIISEVTQEVSGNDGEFEGGAETEGDYLSAILGSVDDIKISITTYGIAKFAFSDDPVDQLIGSAVEEIKKVEKQLITNVAVIFIPQMIESNASEFDIDTDNIDVQAILDGFDNIFSAETADEAHAAINGLAEEIQSQAVTANGDQLIPDEMIAEIEEIITQYYDSAVEALGGEALTFESFICVTVSNMLNDPEEGETATVYTNYHDLISSIVETSHDADESDEAFNEDWITTIFDFATFGAKYFAISMLFFAGIWVLQFLFAFLHMFCKNKRFAMWYTKLLGFIPCLIFGVAPLIAGAILPSLIGEGAATMALVFGAISTMTWISGACYLLLWLVSIFWAFPIKRKIRKALRAGATYD